MREIDDDIVQDYDELKIEADELLLKMKEAMLLGLSAAAGIKGEELLHNEQNVQVCDATDDSMKIKSRAHKKK